MAGRRATTEDSAPRRSSRRVTVAVSAGAVVIIAAVVAIGLYASNGHHLLSGAPTPSPTAIKAAHGAQIPGLPTGVVGATKLPKSVPNVPKLRTDATATGCQSVAGGWEASGTIRNTSKTSQKFRITEYFATTTGGTVLAFAQDSVTVKGSSQADWVAKAHFTAPRTVECILVGVGLQ
jgi:hypothetical protein